MTLPPMAKVSELFGFKPFACDATTCAGGNYSDATYAEVSQRPIYISFNQVRQTPSRGPEVGPTSALSSLLYSHKECTGQLAYSVPT